MCVMEPHLAKGEILVTPYALGFHVIVVCSPLNRVVVLILDHNLQVCAVSSLGVSY